MTRTRKLWAVSLRTPGGANLIGDLWHNIVRGRPAYPGEPTRLLLFTNRRSARAWCRDKNASAAASGDYTRRWIWTPVRVVETIRTLA